MFIRRRGPQPKVQLNIKLSLDTWEKWERLFKIFEEERKRQVKEELERMGKNVSEAEIRVTYEDFLRFLLDLYERYLSNRKIYKV